ncbi:MAG: hypothetical protein LBH01_01300 [Verrucomicrobiales bacterium]|jgi:uncharacterized repeat protein (TIGR04138 family)|nr:hypothetical protein [Verrucomicrobiales bacterium]
MQKNNFDQVTQEIVAKDNRYGLNAYHFVRDALDFTIKAQKKSNSANRHVTGPELLEGIRQFTLREFGPMSKFVLNEWGIATCHDFGQIVFNLVTHGVLGKSDNDRVEDFSETYTFDEAFIKPFLPAPLLTPVRARKKKSPAASRVKTKKGNSLPSQSSSAE